jgi:predicted ATPase
MARIRISNFGPVGEGLTEDEGWLYFEKVTVLIGNQATGKSSVAKLLSTLSWLEKSLYKQEIKESDVTKYHRFRKKYCDYQGISAYFREDTYIAYEGDYLYLEYSGESVKLEQRPLQTYAPPKIMYVPAERNFLSVVADPARIKGLPLPLYTFLDEFEEAKRELKEIINIPVAGVRFEYQRQNKISYIRGENYRLRLQYASSGIQSLLPLYLVSRNLANSIGRTDSNGIKKVSLEQEERIRHDLNRILTDVKIGDDVRKLLLERIDAIYQNLAFINIVEEPEQNLYPASQMALLFELLRLNNSTVNNKLLLTTHSPYLLNYLSLATKAAELQDRISETNHSALERLAAIVPLASTVGADQLHIYEAHADGTITRLPMAFGVPSDDNFLNQSLAETNELFDALLALEEEADVPF